MSDSPSPPPAPDYVGAAQAQGVANKDAAIASAQISNPNISNPYGWQTVEYVPDQMTGNPVPYVNQHLSPSNQALFEKNQGINLNLADVAQQGIGYVKNTLNKPFDASQLPQQQINPGQTAQDAIMSRLAPQLQREDQQLNTSLVNQGLRPGGEAYNNAMTLQSQRANDLKLQAALQGIGVGQQARQQGIQEQEFLRTEPLNVLNAVRSAQQVSTPQFQPLSGANVQPAPIAQAAGQQGQAAQNIFNAQQGAANAQNSGLYSLGGATLGALAYSGYF
jgi:hypothetical protein